MNKMNPVFLVIEDEQLLLKAIVIKLEAKGFKVVPFENGQDAVEYLNKDQPIPDIIWLDYYLKDMNGLEFMQTIKNNPKLKDIPVVVVSNSASPDKVKEMTDLGVRYYLLKATHRLEDIIGLIDREFISGEEAV